MLLEVEKAPVRMMELGVQGKVCGRAQLERGDGPLCDWCNERRLLLVSEGRFPGCMSSVKAEVDPRKQTRAGMYGGGGI